MADDDNNGAAKITSEAARGAVAGTILGGILSSGVAGGKAASGEVISPAEMRTWQEWADKAPGLLREYAAKNLQPEKPFYIDSIISAALGATLAVATFTKKVRGAYKLLTGIGAAATGFYAFGSGMRDWANRRLNEEKQHIQQHVNVYAQGLENNPALRRQLADYLAANMTGNCVAGCSLEEAVIGKTIEFGKKAAHLNTEILDKGVIRFSPFAEQQADKKPCPLCR